jgi:HK97 family phage major capsid protein
MENTDPTPTPVAQAAQDLARRDALMGLGEKYAAYIGIADVQTACREGHAPEKLQELVIERMKTKHSDTRNAHIGMGDKDVARYSLARAVGAMVTGDWKGAGLEREASEAAAQKFGGSSRGILLPMDVMSRAFNVGTAGEAGNLVSTTLRDDMFADVLRNRLAMGRLGATMLFGLTGNVDLPRKTAGAALGWLTEVAGAATTQVNTGKVSLAPKRIGGVIEFSKQAVIQSAMAVEPLLRQDVMSEYQLQFETAALNGSGAGNQPRGLRNIAGVGSVVGGVNGAAPTWAHAVALESACANVNAEPDARSGYLINTRTRGIFKTTQKAANLPFIWENGATPLNGYRAEVTNLVPSNLTKGTSNGNCSSLAFSSNWEMLVMAQFGAVELLLDEVSQAANGLNRLILNAYVDVAARRAGDFSVMDDALAG